ncbi:MAG TPA: penicillin-binding protein activator [Noviherbaspirillum sp.]|nr:penicillin-binding protein activator [Noviherbaspirillum sp.]
MLSLWRKAAVLFGVLGGLCLPVHANTTPGEAATSSTAQAPVAVPSAVDLSSTERLVRVALLLPLRSETLRTAAEAVRAGFQAAHEREKDGIAISIIETGDSPQDTLAGYQNASAQNDIVVGPLSRTGATAVAQSGAVNRPTIALAPPDIAGNPDASQARPPQQMLVVGLSIEEEARQIAEWAGRENVSGKAFALFTKSPWQRRAAKAFELYWQQQGREVEMVELVSMDGFLNGRSLMQLKKDIESGTPPVLFLALDARQARQVRAVIGNDAQMYGTSQLNPFALSERHAEERTVEMDGTRLLDIPWQLQADHPAVMVYPRLVVDADQRRSADMERLYALGIDAYRVARELATDHTNFELDGVTGKLSVQFEKGHTHFERTVQQAVYREGSVVPASE